MDSILSKLNNKPSWKTTWIPAIFLVIGCIVCSFINDLPSRDLAIIGATIFAAVFIVVLAMIKKEKMTWQRAIYFVLFLGFVLRIFYVLYTNYTVRQHDVWYVTSGKGHMAYIQYIANNLSLPAENRTWQFYHPPLHHIFAGLLYRGLSQTGMATELVAEKLQFLTIGYSCLTMLICDRLFAAFKLADKSRFFADCFICFQPTFLLVGGGLNNDMLYIMLAILSVLFLVKWWYEERTSQLILCGLFLGLSMMAKISAVLLAVPYSYVFITKICMNWSKTRKKTISQMLGFGLVSIPIGMWYPIRNLILFHQPLGYIPGFSTKIDQYLGSYSILQRLFSFPPEQLLFPYQCWGKEGEPGKGYNIFLSLFKTSLFGEHSVNGGIWATILLYVFVLVSIIAIVSLISFCAKKSNLSEKTLNYFLFIQWATLFVSFICFCFDYKFICSQDFRYLTLTLPILAISYAKLIEKTKNKKKRIVLEALLSICCLSSYMIYAIPFIWG